jgi:hypothetical protein
MSKVSSVPFSMDVREECKKIKALLLRAELQVVGLEIRSIGRLVSWKLTHNMIYVLPIVTRHSK